MNGPIVIVGGVPAGNITRIEAFHANRRVGGRSQVVPR